MSNVKQEEILLDAYAARLQELEQLVGHINMILVSPRSNEAKLSIVRGLLRADLLKERR